MTLSNPEDAKREPKIHLPQTDCYANGGWNKTECGRVIKPTTRVTDQGVEHATCEACKNMYDFGVLTR